MGGGGRESPEPDYEDDDSEPREAWEPNRHSQYPNYADNDRTPESEEGDSIWDDADALQEPNIVEALKKYQGHQALQQIMYDSMHLRRQTTRPSIPVYEEETGHTEYVTQLEKEDDEYYASEEIRPPRVEIPLRETVDDFVDAVEHKPEVKQIDASQMRDLISPLSQKMKEFRRLQEQVDARVKETSQQRIAKVRQDFRRGFANFWQALSPFSPMLKRIDSLYGADVYSYFVFVLWIVAINITTFMVTFLFGMAPSIFWHDSNGGGILFADWAPEQQFEAADVLTGGGVLRNSIFHYGFYLSNNGTLFGTIAYDRTMGYLLTLGFFYMFQFIVITYSLTHSSGELVSTIVTGTSSKYCETVFFLWEYSTRARDAIQLNKAHLQTTLREKLTAVKRIESFRRSLYFKRFLINFGVFVLIGGICAGLWFILSKLKEDPEPGLAKELAPAIVITLFNLALPFAFSILSKYEQHTSYERELSWSLAKGAALNIGTLGVLFFFSIFETTGQDVEAQLTQTAKKDCTIPRSVSCWETDLSTKFYQLAVMNIIFEWGLSLITIAVVSIQGMVMKNRWQPVFRADLLTQRIIYSQVLTWLASYYSPIMCGIAVFTVFVMFIRDALVVRFTKFYKSAPLGNGSEGTHVVYCATLLGSFLLATASVAFAITALLPSPDCGPFRSLCPEPDIIVAAINRLEDLLPELYMILDIIITPGVMAFIILLLLVFIYYFNVKGNALDELTPILQNHLALEGKDLVAIYLTMVDQPQTDKLATRRKSGHHKNSVANKNLRNGGNHQRRRDTAFKKAKNPDAMVAASNIARTKV